MHEQNRQLARTRRAIGAFLVGVAALLCFSGLSQHAGLSHRIGSALAIPYTDTRLHEAIMLAGVALLLLGAIFFWKGRESS
jgi:LPXTG-motif cell wall-anchored protein